MFSNRTSQFIDRRIGESDKGLSQDEKYSHRLKMVRKKQNKRASKYSLDTETDLTHFGKNLGAMSKTEMRQAYVGSGDEDAEKPFSYDSLIAQSKDERAAARRQKMEAEAELEDLDGTFGTVLAGLARRDTDRDKVRASVQEQEDDDDLGNLARMFQMENIKKAVAGDRLMTEAEHAEISNQLMKRSERDRQAAVEPGSDNEEDDFVVESDRDEEDSVQAAADDTVAPSSLAACSTFVELINHILANPSALPSLRERLADLARFTPATEVDAYFKQALFDPFNLTPDLSSSQLILMRIILTIFPIDHVRHAIAVPALKLVESVCLSPSGKFVHLILLLEFLVDAPKYSPAFLRLAGRLYRTSASAAHKEEVIQVTAEFCSLFTKEALSGAIAFDFPELNDLVSPSASEAKFVPLCLHHFKPVEVLSLEPAFHEDGHEWNGEHKEMREAKKLERQFKQDKKLTVKEMRREAVATEAMHAIQREKKRKQSDTEHKQMIAKMQDAENNYKLMRTDNGKDDGRRMKSNKNKSKKRG